MNLIKLYARRNENFILIMEIGPLYTIKKNSKKWVQIYFL